MSGSRCCSRCHFCYYTQQVPCLILHAAVLEVVAVLLMCFYAHKNMSCLKSSGLGFEAACTNAQCLH